MEIFLCQIWHIPEGFATVLLAVATMLAGSFVIIGAWVAWRGAKSQIKSAENIEKTRHANEITAIEAGFTAELLVYSRGIIQATSIWNQRAHADPNQPVAGRWPVLQDPLFYRANISKIGHFPQKWVAFALIGFYANLLELNEQARESLAGRPTVNVINRSVAGRLHIMASNLSTALDGLNAGKKFPLPPEILLDDSFMPDGRPLSQSKNVPKDIQDVLLQLARGDVPQP